MLTRRADNGDKATLSSGAGTLHDERGIEMAMSALKAVEESFVGSNGEHGAAFRQALPPSVLAAVAATIMALHKAASQTVMTALEDGEYRWDRFSACIGAGLTRLQLIGNGDRLQDLVGADPAAAPRQAGLACHAAVKLDFTDASTLHCCSAA